MDDGRGEGGKGGRGSVMLETEMFWDADPRRRSLAR